MAATQSTSAASAERPASADDLAISSGLVLRAITSENYERVWNHEIVTRLIDLSARLHLEPGRQTFHWDGSAVTAQEIAEAPKALYASDHDMFAFLMSRNVTVTDPTGKAMRRGLKQLPETLEAFAQAA